jgi:hypothetical protein
MKVEHISIDAQFFSKNKRNYEGSRIGARWANRRREASALGSRSTNSMPPLPIAVGNGVIVGSDTLRRIEKESQFADAF